MIYANYCVNFMQIYTKFYAVYAKLCFTAGSKAKSTKLMNMKWFYFFNQLTILVCILSTFAETSAKKLEIV